LSSNFGGRDRGVERFDRGVGGSPFHMHGRNVGPVVGESHEDERWPTFREREPVSGSSLDHGRWGPRSSTKFGRHDRGVEQLDRGVRGSSFYMQGRNEGHNERESRLRER